MTVPCANKGGRRSAEQQRAARVHQIGLAYKHQTCRERVHHDFAASMLPLRLTSRQDSSTISLGFKQGLKKKDRDRFVRPSLTGHSFL